MTEETKVLLADIAGGVKDMAHRHEDLQGQINVLGNSVDEVRRLFSLSPSTFGALGGGRAGAVELGQFVKAAAAKRLGMGDVVQKVAAPWSIDADERGGYVVPPQISNVIDAILRPEGSLLARCQQHRGEPGRPYRLPYFSTQPTAAWQSAENADLDELDLALGAIDRPPIALGGYVDVSHQLLFGQSSFDVGSALITEIFNAARQAYEVALVAGEGGVDAPADGLLQVAGNTQSTLATVTSALVSKFVYESIEDSPALMDGGVLVMAPDVFEALAGNDASSSYTGRLTIGPNGRPRFGLHDVIRTAACPNTDIIMCDPRHVHLVNSGDTIIVDDRSQAKSLTVRIAAVRWAAYGIGLAAAVSKAEITALA